MKSHINKRLITHVYDPLSHDILPVSEQLDNIDQGIFFRKRREIEDGVRAFLCPVCHQRLYLRGETSRTIYHYSHRKSSEDCPLQDKANNLTKEEILAMKFNGQKEGLKHRTAKDFIYETIKNDRFSRFSECQVEATFRDLEPNSVMDKTWRRPDVSAQYTDKDSVKSIVFELQLSTTFISVIAAREDFYQRNNAFVVWVLMGFDGERFTDLDIAYGNRVNVFVLSEQAKKKIFSTGELWFEVHWREPYIESDELKYVWKNELVPFSKLTFHDYYLKVYYKDIDTLEGELKAELQLAKESNNYKFCNHCKSSTDNRFINGEKHCSKCLSKK